jgi:hypothetical protein
MKVRELIAQLGAFAADAELVVCAHYTPGLSSVQTRHAPNPTLTRDVELGGAAVLHVELFRELAPGPSNVVPMKRG